MTYYSITSLYEDSVTHTLMRCLLTHFVKVFFCTLSRSSEEKEIKERKRGRLITFKKNKKTKNKYSMEGAASTIVLTHTHTHTQTHTHTRPDPELRGSK